MRITGVNTVLKNLNKVEKKVVMAAEKGMGKALGQLYNDAVMVTPTVPLKEGTLRGSRKQEIKKTGSILRGTLGLDVPYAAYLHEGIRISGTHGVSNWSEPGSGKKYLQNKLDRFRNAYMKIIGREVKKVL